MFGIFVRIVSQVGLGLVLAPVLAGFIKKVKARAQLRQGPSIVQPWYDLRKLFSKEMVVSQETSWIFKIPPYLEFGIAILLLAFIPVVSILSTKLTYGVDLIFLLYLWGLGRFFSALAGLDAGSAFGGMGGSREMTIAAMVEPGLLLALVLIGWKASSLHISQVFQWAARDGKWFFSPAYLLTAGAFILLLIAETGRIPVDNPDTHLELTMIHEGIILEYSGPFLALINWAVMIKQYLFFAIFVNIFLPGDIFPNTSYIYTAINMALFLCKLLFLGIAVGCIESSLAKMRLLKAPRLLWGAFALGLMAALTVIF